MTSKEAQQKRWRLVLGSPAGMSQELSGDEARIDAALAAIYETEDDQEVGLRGGGMGSSQPRISRWLGDIRKYFPTPVVQVIQKDAIERKDLAELLLEPEVLASTEPDVHLVSTILSLNQIIPEKTRATARMVVKQLVDELMRKLDQPTRSAVSGALSRNSRNRRPKMREIDWHRTIKKNLRHYQEEYKTVIPEQLVGFGRKRQSLKDVVLCIDQSGSMASSVIYSSIFGAVLASMPSLSTRFVLFDTAVVDMTDELHDPVDLLFGAQLGGGTDIRKALEYCAGHVTRPTDTTLVLISDLEEGGDATQLLKCAKKLIDSGVQLIVLLALNDEGTSHYDKRNAGRFAALGAPVFVCTPDQFPELMAASLSRRDIKLWGQATGIKLVNPPRR